MNYVDRIDAPGPKRLLSLDGGGIRGAITLEILAAIEGHLRESHEDPALVLSDVFDYIGGTSTGAIIAAGLALGHPVSDLLDLYEQRGAEMFDEARIRDRAHHRYRTEPLEAILKDEMGADTTFGSDDLQSLLLIVLRNATTDSPWPLSNNPRGRFNDEGHPGSALDVPLWQLVRASTAAPAYFQPERIRFGEDEFVFVDGSITPFNNPAFQLFLMATLQEYRLEWPTGVDDLQLVSVGTGTTPKVDRDLEVDDMHLVYHATATPLALINSSVAYQDMLCRVFGECKGGGEIDLEVGDLCASPPLGGQDLFSYVRYDLPLTRSSLDRYGLTHIDPGDVRAIDSVTHIEKLREVGAAYTAATVQRGDPAEFA